MIMDRAGQTIAQLRKTIEAQDKLVRQLRADLVLWKKRTEEALLGADDDTIIAMRNPWKLTPMELRTLLALLRKPKGASTLRLLRAVYFSQPEQPEPKIIHVYVCKLRKKLSDGGVHEAIRTVNAAGYVIEPAPRARIVQEIGFDPAEHEVELDKPRRASA